MSETFEVHCFKETLEPHHVLLFHRFFQAMRISIWLTLVGLPIRPQTEYTNTIISMYQIQPQLQNSHLFLVMQVCILEHCFSIMQVCIIAYFFPVMQVCILEYCFPVMQICILYQNIFFSSYAGLCLISD